MARSSPLVLDTTLVTPTGTEIAVGSPAWYAWLAEAQSFAYRGATGRFTARKERHGAHGWRWKAYQRRDGTLHSAYLGHTPDLNADRLRATAATLAQRGTVSPSAPVDTTGNAATPPPVQEAAAAGAPLLATKLYLPKGRPGRTTPLNHAPQRRADRRDHADLGSHRVREDDAADRMAGPGARRGAAGGLAITRCGRQRPTPIATLSGGRRAHPRATLR